MKKTIFSSGLILFIMFASVAMSAINTGQLETTLGVVLPIPLALKRMSQKEVLAYQKMQSNGQGGEAQQQTINSVEGVYQTEGEWPVFIAIISAPWGAKYGLNEKNALAGLPEKSGKLSDSYANSFFEGYLSSQKKIGFGELRQNTTVTPLSYDHERKMAGAELTSSISSPARTLLAMKDSSPVWLQIKKQGIEPKLYRCVLGAIANEIEAGNPQNQANKSASQLCKVNYSTIVSISNKLTPEYFKRFGSVERILQIVTKKGVTAVRIEGNVINEDMINKYWDLLWSDTKVLNNVAIHEGPFSRIALTRIGTASFLGGLVGSCVMIGFLTILLRKIFVAKVGMVKATILAAVVSVILALIISTFSGMGQDRFLLYPIGGFIIVVILGIREKLA